MNDYDHKYELTDRTMVNELGITLHRIRALKDFNDVHCGDLGGWIESEYNLSQDGDAWVCDDAEVFSDARIYDDACISNNARIFGSAQVCARATVFGSAQIYDMAIICGNARVAAMAHVHSSAIIRENAWVFGTAKVSGGAEVAGRAFIGGETQIFDTALIYDNARVLGHARVFEEARVFGNARVSSNAQISGHALVLSNMQISMGAIVNNPSDCLEIGPIGSRNGFTTFYKTKTGITAVCGCFVGSLNDFLAQVDETHRGSKHAETYKLAAELAMEQIGKRSDESV